MIAYDIPSAYLVPDGPGRWVSSDGGCTVEHREHGPHRYVVTRASRPGRERGCASLDEAMSVVLALSGQRERAGR